MADLRGRQPRTDGSSGSDVPLVAHVIHELGTGGLENGLVNIINRTPNGRYRHAIICLTESGIFEQRLSDPDVVVIPLHGKQGKDFKLYWKVWKTLFQLRPAIVHTRNLSALEAQIPAFFIPRIKTVHGVHGRDVFDLEGKNRKYNFLRKMIRPIVGRYITVSKDLKAWLIDAIGVAEEKITQIYNGVDQTLFKPGERRPEILPDGFVDNDSVVVGTVGRLAEVKDQATLIRAFARVLQSLPLGVASPRLILVGDGPVRSRLERLIDELGIDKQVWMTGDRSDIGDMLRTLDVFVLPSLGEGISNTILEAMATGLPIIATDVGGNPELVSDGINGYLVPVGDAELLAKSITRLVLSKAERSRMGQASIEKIRDEFDWSHTVESYLTVYDKLLEKRQPPLTAEVSS